MKKDNMVYIDDWNSVPEILSKEDLRKICHIGKSRAEYLLKSGKIPCEYTGKKTRCYRIHKEDVKKFLDEMGDYPAFYSAPEGWYKRKKKDRDAELPPFTKEAETKMNNYYLSMLTGYNDLITTNEVAELTGYTKTTITRWCSKIPIKHFYTKRICYIPKVILAEFFCSSYFRNIGHKTLWHKKTLFDFYCLLNMEKKRRQAQ